MGFEFGEFRLDPGSRELRRAGEPVAVEPKVLDLLIHLVGEGGRVVSRAALERRLWPGTSVSPAALSRLVKEARRALGDDGRGQALLETRRGRGYRFAGEVLEREDPLDDRYIGRRDLLRHVDAVLEAAFRGVGHVVLLRGEPGLGKTRTAEELAARGRLLGAQVATAWASAAEGAPGYWPWIQALRALAESCGPEALRTRLGPSASALGRLVPELGVPGAGAPPPGPPGGAAERFGLFDGVRAFLARSAGEAPVVLVLDDLHGADQESVELLDFLAHDVPHTPLVVLATYREPELERRVHMASALARLASRPGVERWGLEAFSAEEARAFIAACATAPLAPAVVDLLRARSEGSPLFLGEILRQGVQTGLAPDDVASWDALTPLGLATFVEQRVRALPPTARGVLSCAAAIGPEFEPALLSRVASVPADEVQAAIEEAEAARVVVREPGRGGTRRFTHALVRDELYAELDAAAAPQVHARIVSALEQSAGGAAPDALAHHCCEAISVLGAARALDACARAGERARRMNAFDRAVRHTERALELLGEAGEAAGGRRCGLLLQLGEAQRLRGDGESARGSFDRAAALARRDGAAEALASAALGFADLYAYGPPDAAVVERLEGAARCLGPEHEALRARLLGRLASELMLDGDRRRRRELRRRAWIAAANGGDLAATVEIAALPDHGIWDTCVPPSRRLPLALDYVERTAARGMRMSELAARVMVLDELLRRGRPKAFDEWAPDADRLAAEVCEPRLLWARRLQGFSRAMTGGCFEAAERCAEEALAFGRRHLHPLAALTLWGRQLAVLRAEQGRLAELREPWEQAGAGAGTPSNRALHAWIRAADGDLDGARRVAAPLLAGRAETLLDEPMASANAAVLAEVCVALGWCEPAAALLELLRPYAGMNALRTYAASHGPVDHFRGLLESLRGRRERAARCFRAAVALSERMGARPWAVRSRRALEALEAHQ